MSLANVFRRELIKLDLEGKTKDEVFEELVEIIACSYPGYDRREMLEAVISRENRMNTAILPGIAAPHGYYPTVDGIIGAVGFSRAGIEYESPGLVHSVFLLLMDESSREYHLRVLGRLVELFNSDYFTVIQKAESPRQVYDVLSRF